MESNLLIPSKKSLETLSTIKKNSQDPRPKSGDDLLRSFKVLTKKINYSLSKTTVILAKLKEISILKAREYRLSSAKAINLQTEIEYNMKRLDDAINSIKVEKIGAKMENNTTNFENVSTKNEDLQELIKKLVQSTNLRMTSSSSMDECIRKALLYWKNFESTTGSYDGEQPVSMADRQSFLTDTYQIIRYYMVVKQIIDGVHFFHKEHNSVDLNRFFSHIVETVSNPSNTLTADELNKMKKESSCNESNGDV